KDDPAALIPSRDKDDAAEFVTANFLVLAPTEEMACTVGRRAEAERERLAALWFGQQSPNWRGRCVIRVKTAKKAAGATVFQYDEKRLYAPKQEIRVEGPMSEILKDVLP